MFAEIKQKISNTNRVKAQSLDTDVQRPFYSVATAALLPYS